MAVFDYMVQQLHDIHLTLLVLTGLLFVMFLFQLVGLAIGYRSPRPKKKVVTVKNEKTGKVEKRVVTKPEW